VFAKASQAAIAQRGQGARAPVCGARLNNARSARSKVSRLATPVCLANVVAMSDDLPDLRASHADRDRVVDALRVAGGDGRLSAESAKTAGVRLQA
jgi:hypothetical protein